MDATPAASPTADTVEDQECLDALGRADEASRESALEAARALSREQQQAQYEEAVHQLNDMLAKAEQFNATCEKLASGSSFLCKDTPAGFTGGVLRDYQQQGVEWLSTKHFLGESGIIADEMGLGKTVQIIAYVSWMRAAPVSDGPVLIVVPLSTLRNWVNEFRKFAPDIPVVEYHGTPEERASLRRRHIPGCPRWAATVPKARRRSSAGSAGSAAARRRGVATMEREDRCAMPVFITTYSLAMNDSAVLGKGESVSRPSVTLRGGGEKRGAVPRRREPARWPARPAARTSGSPPARASGCRPMPRPCWIRATPAPGSPLSCFVEPFLLRLRHARCSTAP